MPDELILAALSSSSARVPVLGYAELIASMARADVAALHVTESGDDVDLDVRDDLAFGERSTLRTVDGDPVPTIVSAAYDPRVCLVVAGAHVSPTGRGPGRSTRELAVRLTQPLLIVPKGATVPSSLDRVVLPLDGPESPSASICNLLRSFPFAEGAEMVPISEPRAEAVPALASALDASLIALSWDQVFAPGRARLVNAVLGAASHPTLLVPRIARCRPLGAATSIR